MQKDGSEQLDFLGFQAGFRPKLETGCSQKKMKSALIGTSLDYS
jgi:hypothetical protein